MLQLVMALLALAMELGAGLALHEAWRCTGSNTEDWDQLRQRLAEIQERLVVLASEITRLQDEPQCFSARFWRNFYHAMLTHTMRSAMTKLMVVAVALLFVSLGHAAAQSRTTLVIAVDVTQSVAVKGPDEKSEFQKNIETVTKQLAEVPADSKVTVIGSRIIASRSPTFCCRPEFLPIRDILGSYKAIRANPAWSRRLAKVHTQGRRSLPDAERGRWRELDTCTSSDALLMNIFCHPSLSRTGRVSALVGAEPRAPIFFGYKARVPLANGRFDRTEVDLRLGDVLVEAKLTESDFQTSRKGTLLAYRDFADVFDPQELPQTYDRYFSYQLLRNVLAAYALQCSFCVLVDSRRPDLVHAWYAVVKCVKPIDLRTRLRISTWQELAQAAPPRVRTFLADKYGIDGQ